MRHYDDDMIDFRVSDAYRDFYALQGLTYPSGRQPRPAATPTPRRDEATWESLGELVKMLRAQHAEIERLKKSDAPPEDSPNGFEGVE